MKMFLAFLVCAVATPVFSALGGAPMSRGGDEGRPEKLAAAPGSPGAVEVRKTLDGATEIHEFLNSAGTVFAVAWNGPSLPDLQQLFGKHFQVLMEQQRQQHGMGARMQVRRDDLVIASRGRMGAFEGRAWVPSLLPAGFSTDDIR